MKKFNLFVAAAMLVSGMALSSCSSKEVKSGEPVVSGGTTTETTTVVENANLGGASSGQGR